MNAKYHENMQKELTNVVVSSEPMIIPDKTSKKNTVSFAEAGAFPDFKRHDYDEGQLLRKPLHFLANSANFLGELGQSLVETLYLSQKTLSPCELSLLRLSVAERSLFLRNLQEKPLISKENPQFSEENPLQLAIAVLRAGLLKENVELIEEDEAQRLSLFSLRTLHLFSTNCSYECLLLDFRDQEPNTFAALSAQPALRSTFLSAICAEISQILDNSSVAPFAFLRPGEKPQKTLQVCVFLRNFSGKSLQALRISAEAALSAQFSATFLGSSCDQLLKTLRIRSQDWNPYANREFRENMPAATTALLRTLGGFPYYKPGNGWKRFAFDVSHYAENCTKPKGNPGISQESPQKTKEIPETNTKKSSFFEKSKEKSAEDDWLKPANNETADSQTQWANGYASFLKDLREVPGFFSESLANCEDCGPNRENFPHFCGKGVVFSHRLESFCEKSGVSRTVPVEIIDNSQEKPKKRWFLAILQCRVRPQAIRVPKNFETEVFLANNPEDVRPNGLLLKEISKEEAERLGSLHK